MRRITLALLQVLLVLVPIAATPGCLVVSVYPLYGEATIGWDPALLGSWRDDDDNVTVEIEADEWKSYRIRYVHPIESGDLTAYLTTVGNDRYMDLTPVRGKDHGSFLVPVHTPVRVRLDRDTLEVTPVSYDWFVERFRTRAEVPGLAATFDQKSNVLVLSSAETLRGWLRRQPPDGSTFAAPAIFARVKRHD